MKFGFSAILLFIMSFVIALSTNVVGAAPACPNGVLKAGVCFPSDTGLSERSIEVILGTLVGWLAFIFSTIAVIVFIICGIRYLFSLGDSTEAENAKNCMKWAIVGALVAGGSFVILKTIAFLLLGIM